MKVGAFLQTSTQCTCFLRDLRYLMSLRGSSSPALLVQWGELSSSFPWASSMTEPSRILLHTTTFTYKIVVYWAEFQHKLMQHKFNPFAWNSAFCKVQVRFSTQIQTEGGKMSNIVHAPPISGQWTLQTTQVQHKPAPRLARHAFYYIPRKHGSS